MSMNLHISVNGQELDVYQTPTYISSMCMIDGDGLLTLEKTGSDARVAVYMYLEWVLSLSDGRYESREEADRARDRVISHERYIVDKISEGEIKVSIM